MSVTCPVIECRSPVDLVLRSSDGVLIGAHQFNLEHFSQGFPTADSVTANMNEPVDLTESSKTLINLLQFMHNAPQPDVYSMPPDDLFCLAYAAEKYFVHSAKGVCYATILANVKDKKEYCRPALTYAVKFGHPTIIDLTAPSIRYETRAEAKVVLGDPTAYRAWLEYKLDSIEKMDEALLDLGGEIIGICPRWKEWHGQIAGVRRKGTSSYLQAAYDGSLLSDLRYLVKKSFDTAENYQWEEFDLKLPYCDIEDPEFGGRCECYSTQSSAVYRIEEIVERSPTKLTSFLNPAN